MSGFIAQNLQEISKAISLEPLAPGDERYADLSAARGTRELKKLRQYLENCAAGSGFACAAFIGHRGSGKSTELARLEQELQGTFTTLHLSVDNSLQLDCDYTDLLLWLVDSLVRFMEKENLPLDAAKAAAVAEWFAEKTVENADSLKKEIALETEAETTGRAGVNLGFFGYSLKLMARLKARMVATGSIGRWPGASSRTTRMI